MVSSLDVVIVGPVAPPYGGIATHIERMASLLRGNGLQVGILDHFSHEQHSLVIGTLRRNPLRYWWEMRRLRVSVVHYHHARWSTLIAASLARRRCGGAWIVTFHGHDVEPFLGSRIPGVSMLTQWAISRFDRVIAVSAAVADGVSERTGVDVMVVPAYLPADVVDQPEDEASQPPTVIVAAYCVGKTSSDDLYGIDIAGAVYASASAVIPDLCLKLSLAQAPSGSGARRYLERALAPAHRAVPPERVSIYVGAELAPAFRPGAVYLRTTRTDGDAVSVREALDAGVPVVASDVVKRPTGVLTLSLKGIDAWVAAIGEVLEQGSLRRDRPQPSLEHARAIVSLYRELIDQPRNAPAPNVHA
jgi:glycosyltransferase involved in cell wall biosynthesis